MSANFIESLRKQTKGYKFGTPKRVDEKSLSVVLPIFRETTIPRQYITLPETDKVLTFDTGKIDQMECDNNSEFNVFIRSGTLFRGSTQERALQRSAVVFPGKKTMLSVRCVHASRGIRPSAKTGYGGITPLNHEQQVYDDGFHPKDQGSYWHAAQNTTAFFCKTADDLGKKASFMARSAQNSGGGKGYGSNAGGISRRLSSAQVDSAYHIGSQDLHGGIIGADMHTGYKADDLSANLDSFATNFDDVLSKVRLEANQAGIALITDKGVETIEVFDHSDSWKALHEAAVKRMGAEMAKQDVESVFDFNPDKAISLVDKVLGLEWKTERIFEHRPSNGEPKVEITGLTAEKYVGEIVEVNGSVIHLVILRKIS